MQDFCFVNHVLEIILCKVLTNSESEEAENGQNVKQLLEIPTECLQNPSQKVVQKLAAEVWNRLPQEAKQEDWSGVEKAEQMQFIKLAQEVLASE